jgi:hypothetical protein
MIYTKNILNIYWDSNLGEISGQTFYLYSNDINYSLPKFPFELWPKLTEAKSHKLFGENWVIWLWDVKFSEIPNNWKKITEDTLRFFFEKNSIISWCGLGGYFIDPPDLFDPKEMSNGVYAVVDANGVFICHSDLDSKYEALTDNELLMLHNVIKNNI